MKTKLGKLLGEKSVVIRLEDGEELDITPEVEALIGAFGMAIASLIGAGVVKTETAPFSVHVATKAYSFLWEKVLRKFLKDIGVDDVDVLVKQGNDMASQIADVLLRQGMKMVKLAREENQ